MTARFAVSADAPAGLALLNQWRADTSNDDVYTPEARNPLTLAEIQTFIGGQTVIIETLQQSVAALIMGYREPSYIDGKAAVRLTEILVNPQIATNQKMAALTSTMNDLAVLLRSAGAHRYVAETFEDSRMWAALKVLITQAKIPPINELARATREKANGSEGTLLFLEWPL